MRGPLFTSFLFLVCFSLQCLFSVRTAFPLALEKKLKEGRSWIYLPLGWSRSKRLRIRALAFLLFCLSVGLGAASIALFTHRRDPASFLAFALALALLLLPLDAYLRSLAFRQQEDLYYFVHDELKRQAADGPREMSDAAVRNLASFRHQSLLRKADEAGKLSRELKHQLREYRRMRGTPSPAPLAS